MAGLSTKKERKANGQPFSSDARARRALPSSSLESGNDLSDLVFQVRSGEDAEAKVGTVDGSLWKVEAKAVISCGSSLEKGLLDAP